MKRYLYLLVAVVVTVCMSSCSNQEVSPKGNDEMVTLHFNVLNYEQISFDGGSRAETIDSLVYLAMAIYDAETNQLVGAPVVRKKGTDDYGSFGVKLAYGKYRVVFLGYNSSKELHPEDASLIYWTNNVVTDTFLYSMELTVDEETEPNKNIVLSRVVAAFVLKSSGVAVPENFDHFSLKMTGGDYKLNAFTGFAGGDAQRDYQFASNAKLAGQTDFEQYAYAFLPSNETMATITIVAEDKSGAELKSRTFRNVPMKINQITRYSGDFFGLTNASETFSLSLEEKDWDLVEEHF